MKKINLLTIHFGRSYGAVMQTYATCQILQGMGYNVTVINLECAQERNSFARQWRYIITNIQFRIFKKRYFPCLTKVMHKIELEKIPPCDITIVGSDQVWNRDITGIFGNAFYLDFCPQGMVKISLSSSFGKSIWVEDENYTQQIRKLLSKFKAISVREDSGVKILKETFNLDSTQLIDPTLVCGDYSKFQIGLKNKKIIFPFLFGVDEESKSILNAISNMLNVPIYKQSKTSYYFNNGPMNWLRHIAHSEYIVTNSFHGLAFSLIFHKKFFILCADKSKFTRLLSLLKLLNLENRYISSLEDLRLKKNSLLDDIDYNQVDEKLSKERSKYVEFIRASVGE